MSSGATAQDIIAATPVGGDAAAAAGIVSCITRRLIPFLCLLFVVNYLDRTNVAMAKLRMLGDAGISEAAYGLGAGLFFIGYFLFEVPSNLILERVGARIWIARIMITWGVISAAMMFVRGPRSFFALRFILGIAEAGFFPGIVLYLTYWVPCSRRAGALAAFLTSTAISGIIGNPLAGVLMKMDGLGGLHGWQWLFLLEGIVPIVLGLITLALLPDRPGDAGWLSPEQRKWLQEELERDGGAAHPQHHVAQLTHALADARLWMLSLLYFLLIMGLYGFVYWAPSIIRSVSKLSDLQIGMISAVPYLVAAVTMVFIGHHADRHHERRWHVAVCALLAAAGVAMLSQCHTLGGVIVTMCVATIGIFGSLGPFWALSTRFLRGTAAAGGIAIVNSIGALAGFVSPYAIGWTKDRYHSFTIGLLMVAASLVCGAALVLCVPRAVDRDGEG